MDGVLIDAKQWHYDALNQALNLFGYHIGTDDHHNIYDGLPTAQKLNMLTESRQLPHELHSFINEMKQFYLMRIATNQCVPNFIHEYALSKLQQDGFIFALCSNSIRHSVDRLLELSALATYFDITLSNEDVTYCKPDPEIYLKAMEMLNYTPDQCLIIEDNENGIKAAQASGAHYMVVSDVAQTNYHNITHKIMQINKESHP